MPQFFESLEGRTFLSATSVGLATTALTGAALVQPLATPVPVPGNYAGSISVAGIHIQGVTLTLNKRAIPTKFVGTLTASADPSIQVHVVVKVTGTNAIGKRFINITLSGSHSGGVISGTGTGIITAAGKLKVFNVVFIQNGTPFAGTVVVNKV